MFTYCLAAVLHSLKEEGRPSQVEETAYLARLCIFNSRFNQGLRGQPTYDGNGVTSPIARFRRPCDDGTGAMPYAISGVGRSVGPFKLLGPRFQVMDLLTQC